MSETNVGNHGAVAGQVDCLVRPPAPMRAVRLTLKLDADDMRELAYALRTIADHAERGELTIGVSGGPCSGYIYELLQDPTMTHDAYHAELRAYLDVLKQPPPVVCRNCDTALPEGCGGLFKDDGKHCRLNAADLWRCTVCGRIGTVGRCCGEETREPVRAPNA